MKTKNIVTISASSLVLMFAFQNCHNSVKYSEIPSTNGALGAPDESEGSGDGGNGVSGDNSALGGDQLGESGQEGSGSPEIPLIPENPFDPGPGISLLPIDGEWASIAYEDNILDASAGDRDYNDAVFNYKISEQYNSANQLVRIFFEVRLREKISSNDHVLHLKLDGDASAQFDNIKQQSAPAFNGSADAKITYSDGSETEIVDAKSKDLIVFKSTSNTKGEISKITIELKNPELNVNSAVEKYVNFLKYRFILQNKGQSRTGIDIAEVNPSQEMLSNGNGYPFGFMIPTDWQPPAEHQLIDDKYPSFHKYREWLNAPTYPIADDIFKWYL